MEARIKGDVALWRRPSVVKRWARRQRERGALEWNWLPRVNLHMAPAVLKREI